ncbi:neurocan core protein [Elysia marginata]|uniref:Neurocan core protein n=1 Tax=Elysia marginata TaxID=1093978 RepID=A0AAV4GUW7_9GAST|nr:neurocan core protein [Elysia marginata]
MLLNNFERIYIILHPALCTNHTVRTSCPRQLVHNYGAKYFGIFGDTCYQFVTKDSGNYETAWVECLKKRGNLAMPKTKEVNDFLWDEMKRLWQWSPMWIGMNDKDIEGEWYWEDGSKVVPWDGVMHKHTDGLFSGGEDCMALDPSDGKWHDYRCEASGIWRDINLSYICEYPI